MSPCRTAFIRDVAAYLAAAGVTLVLLWDGQFARAEAVILLVLYVVYLAICVYTSRWAAESDSPVFASQEQLHEYMKYLSRARQAHSHFHSEQKP